MNAPGLPSYKVLLLQFQANPRSSKAGLLSHDVPSFPTSLSFRHHGVAEWTTGGCTLGIGGHGEVYKPIIVQSLEVTEEGSSGNPEISSRRVSVSESVDVLAVIYYFH